MDLRGISVLVADDIRDNRILLKKILESAGCKVDLASDGLEAVELATDNVYDVVIMDVEMPRQDGYGATRCLRALGFLVPIIALTAYTREREEQRALAAGCSEYLAKPVTAKKLLETLQRYGRHEAPRFTPAVAAVAETGFALS